MKLFSCKINYEKGPYIVGPYYLNTKKLTRHQVLKVIFKKNCKKLYKN